MYIPLEIQFGRDGLVMNYYLGIDLGGTNIAAGVVDEALTVLAKHSIPTGAHRPFEAVVADMALAATEAVQKAGLRINQFTSLGVGTPGCVNPCENSVVFANNLGWHNARLDKELQKHINLPVLVRNDADCAAYGETLAGAARGCDNALMVTLGTGVGGGFVLQNRIFSGADHLGGELGHTVLMYNGLPCSCGQRGCYEMYASATALIRQTRDAMIANPTSLMNQLCPGGLDSVSGRTAFQAARQGDASALAVVDQYVSYIAAGIASLVAVLRPDIVIIGGGICNEGDYLLTPLNQKLREFTLAADAIGVPRVVAATLGNDAGIIGAALLERQS